MPQTRVRTQPTISSEPFIAVEVPPSPICEPSHWVRLPSPNPDHALSTWNFCLGTYLGNSEYAVLTGTSFGTSMVPWYRCSWGIGDGIGWRSTFWTFLEMDHWSENLQVWGVCFCWRSYFWRFLFEWIVTWYQRNHRKDIMFSHTRKYWYHSMRCFWCFQRINYQHQIFWK